MTDNAGTLNGDYCPPHKASDDKPSRQELSQQEIKAIERLRDAGISAPEYAMVSWIRAVGPETIISASIADIRNVANGF
jgi:hypothetical protein